jgi:hypothetical protein
MAKTMCQISQLAMILGMGEPLQLSRSLLTRSGPTQRDKPILPLLTELPQLIPLLADIGASIPHPFLSKNEHFLLQIR